LDNNKVIPVTKFEKAENLENEAFSFLFDKDVDNAIKKFSECENTYPSYHSVYDILKILRKEKQNLTTDNDANWKKLYAEILNNYSWKLSNEVLTKLRELSK
jgi:hypothetical protein